MGYLFSKKLLYKRGSPAYVFSEVRRLSEISHYYLTREKKIIMASNRKSVVNDNWVEAVQSSRSFQSYYWL